MQRAEIADLIADRIAPAQDQLGTLYSQARAKYFVQDDLLPPELARRIYEAFPPTKEMMLRRSLRELKYVTSQMDQCNRLVEETVFAFQEPRVVELVSSITGIPKLEPDPKLYAGGISVMQHGHFLNPHVDNSHDKNRERYRVLNLLYYVSPEWKSANGGHLELWPDGVRGKSIVIESKFNRLVVMATTRSSWHSVNSVKASGLRCCVSNYYFSDTSPDQTDYFHVTSFRGRPEQPVRALILRADASLRMAARRFVRLGVVKTKHYYRH